MKISFLIHTVYGIGGTIRTTLNLAEELANRHEVEIVSVFRHRDDAAFALDPRLSVVPLVDIREGSEDLRDPLISQPATVFPRAEARYKEYSRLTDERVRAHYAGSDADVVIGTRPGLVACVARFAPVTAVRIGQEHMTHNHHRAALREEMYEHLDALDAFVTVSEGDAQVWRDKMPLPTTRVLSIPNSVPEPSVPPSDGGSRTVVAAGRLSGEKQYDVLVDAFAVVAARRPEWTLRIYGSGDQHDRLWERITGLGLYNRVHLMGPCSPIEPEWSKGAVAVSTSRHESFGMTLVEAMRCGVPVVSTDCDYGPREIIRDGVDGLLVPVGDAAAVARGLLRLIDDGELRRSMAAEAVRGARRFDPGVVTKQYEALFGELAAEVAERVPVPGMAPVADCAVARDGAVRVTLVAPLPAGIERGARLVCTRTGERTEVRSYAVDEAGSALIPAGDAFPEGVWNVFVELAGGAGRGRVTARIVDQRGALHAAERVGPGTGVRHLLPYEDKAKAGALMLRAWHRPVHAEAADVRIDGPTVTFEGGMLGTAAIEGRPELVLRRRGRPDDEITVPGERVGEDGFRFRFSSSLPAASQTTAHDVWDFHIRCVPGGEPVRIGRLLDDVVGKQRSFAFPHTVLSKHRQENLVRAVMKRVLGRPAPKIRVHVYYTLSNDLALNVVDL
ncbi:glycosyltransferase family 4 protein [Streptomyces zhihengii]|uniref:D-inositol 3-phosphate glycosyltransferase n=1 Tax=Streptomyces zhihengii TaxID=1818004 RepID=A0ABS2UVW8_9ACTN|nr:glycosyltransferase family 4 protein [Streptomyces zhihengii]MBM9621619.1 glycosyltransferase family 4 protein [Streptomyces zhihengii]